MKSNKIISALSILIFIRLITGQDNDSKLWKELTEYYTPAKIYSLTDTGKMYYKLLMNSEIAGTDLTALKFSTDSISPNFIIDKDKNGKNILVEEKPNEKTSALIHLADSCFSKERYNCAADYYEQAIKEQKELLKPYVLAGNCYFILNDYKKAKDYLEYAVAKNPIDYQAHFFLADTYLRLGNFKKAENEIAIALMLNKSNSRIQQFAEDLMKINGKKFRKDRFLIPAEYREFAKDSVVMTMKDKESIPWLHYMSCLLVWQFEPEMKKFREYDDAIRQTCNKHCLLNLVLSAAASEKKKHELPENQRYILEALGKGYRDAIIYWEFGASMVPFTTLLLPDDIKKNIIEYIKEFVFVKK